MFSELGPEEIEQLKIIFLLLLPATFYGLGLMEGKWAKRFFHAGIAVHLLVIAYRSYTVAAFPSRKSSTTYRSWRSARPFCTGTIHGGPI